MRSGRSLALLCVLFGTAAAIAFLLGVALDLYWLRLLVKPVPALALAVAVWSWGRRPDARAITVGLVLSAVGDIFLEVSAETFLYGVGAFLLAHVVYIFAFVGAAPEPRWLRAIPFAAWGAAFVWWLAPGLQSAGMLVPVAVYSTVICLMMWRASVRWADGTRAGKAAFLGALLFGASDSLIAIDRFGGLETPGIRYAIILLYWAGQIGIAASSRSERPA
jgi:uncharacterized membrane protein YhhN